MRKSEDKNVAFRTLLQTWKRKEADISPWSEVTLTHLIEHNVLDITKIDGAPADVI